MSDGRSGRDHGADGEQPSGLRQRWIALGRIRGRSLASPSTDAAWFSMISGHQRLLERHVRGQRGGWRFPASLERDFQRFSRIRASRVRAMMALATTLLFLLTPLWAILLGSPLELRSDIAQLSLSLFLPACLLVTAAQLLWPTQGASEWLFMGLFLAEAAAVEVILHLAVAQGYSVNPISSVAVALAVLSLGRLPVRRALIFALLYAGIIAISDQLAPGGRPLRHGTDLACMLALLSIALLATAFSQNNRRQIWSLLQLSQVAAWLDPLTGLPNRGAYKRHIEQALKAAAPEAAHTLALIDLDHFKLINDHYGHVHGDGVLREVALCVSEAAGASGDIAARIGGEEFALFLHGCSGAQAAPRLEQLREQIRALVIDNPDSAQGVLSASIGAVALRPDECFVDAYHRADQCLYEAKRAGRNRLCLG